MLHNVHLHGGLAAFGGPYQLDVSTPREAAHALGTQLKGFRQAIGEGRFRVVRGDPDNGFHYDAATLNFPIGRASTDLHFIPVIGGSGRSGKAAAKIVIGVALVGTGVGFGIAAGAAAGTGIMGGLATSTGFLGITWGQIAFTGASLLFGGIASLLSPAPTTSYANREPQDRRESFLFSSLPFNLAEPGNAVTLVYGNQEVGGMVVSVGMSTERLP